MDLADVILPVPPPSPTTPDVLAAVVFGAPCGARWWTFDPLMDQLNPGALEVCAAQFAAHHRYCRPVPRP